MLLRFQVANHASIRREQELSLVAADSHADRAERPVPGSRDHRVVPVAAIFGPNASGKSNVIDAVRWMRDAVLHSFRSWDPEGGVPRRAFAVSGGGEDAPSTYLIDFVMNDVRYEFGFSVDDREVLEEWLFEYPENRRRRLYERTAGQPPLFGRALGGRKRVIAELLRPNCLLLSAAAAQGHPRLSEVHAWFQNGLRGADGMSIVARTDHTADLFLSRGPRREAAAMLLRAADLGIVDLDVTDPDEREIEQLRRVERAVSEALGSRVRFEAPRHLVRVRHRAGEADFTLDLNDESSGTRTWIGLIAPLLTTLGQGTVLFVDELDAFLHPHLVDLIVGLFQNPEVNERGAQLIFSTHEAVILGHGVRTELRRDQVWFTEKHDLETRIFPMTDFHVRDSVENLEKRYLDGRYGAVPLVEDDVLSGVVSALRAGGTSGTRTDGTSPEPEPEAEYQAGAVQVPDLLRR